jgi:hypothetical protein
MKNDQSQSSSSPSSSFDYNMGCSFTEWTSYLTDEQKDPNECTIAPTIQGQPNTKNIILQASGIVKMRTQQPIWNFYVCVRRYNNLGDEGMPRPGHFITLSNGTIMPEINQGCFITYSGKWYVIDVTLSPNHDSSSGNQRGIGDIRYCGVFPPLVFMQVIGAITVPC